MFKHVTSLMEDKQEIIHVSDDDDHDPVDGQDRPSDNGSYDPPFDK